MAAIKVLLIDPQEIFRVGIEKILAGDNEIKIIGSVGNGDDGIAKSRELSPDLIILDIDLPGMGGIEAVRKLFRYVPKAKVIVLSTLIMEPFPSKLLEMGVKGYLSKSASANELREAIRAVAKGQHFLSPVIAQELALHHVKQEKTPFDGLSSRELQVMQYMIKGEKAPVIAKKLFIQGKTINTYRYRIFEKLGVSSDVDVTHLAIKHGLINVAENNSKQLETDSVKKKKGLTKSIFSKP